MAGSKASDQHEKVDFDQYASNYKSLLDNQTTMFGGERAYFSSYKVDILSRLFGNSTGSFLDFGSGIGLLMPFIQDSFAHYDIYATDISEQSLSFLRDNFPRVTIVDDNTVTNMRFDIILLSGVLHHVEPKFREGLMRRLASMLKPGGSLCIFEHNPYNPVTQRLVSTCEFDSDAVLLSKKETAKLLRTSGGLNITHESYTLFFPHPLRGLRFLEPNLGWLPLGGQYYVIGQAH